MEEKKVIHFPYDPNGPIANGIRESKGINTGPQQATIPDMINATVDPATLPETYATPDAAIQVDVGNDSDHTAIQYVDPDGKVIARGETCGGIVFEAEPSEEVMANMAEANGWVNVDDPDNQNDDSVAGDQESEESKPLIEDEENPLNEHTESELQGLLQQVQEMVKIMESQWLSSKEEYGVNEGHMKQLYKFNEDHRDPMPEGLTPEEQDNWNHFNGLKKLTEEDVEAIFGKDHQIIGVQHTVTLDRIEAVVNDFFSWTYAMREYRNIHDAYLELIEIEEEKNIEELKAIAAAEQDPEKKANMEKAVARYYYMKNLEFLADEMDEGTKKRLSTAWADERKIEYWINRARDKMRRMKINTKFILEISKFEIRFLDEKYHRISNILLTYFLNIATYSDPDDKHNENRTKTVCMVFALDAFVQNRMSKEKRTALLNNILAFEDQMLAYMPDNKEAKE